MHVLLVGGAGRVGRLVTPYLKQRHRLRVLDPRDPRDASVDWVAGSLRDPRAARAALEGIEGIVYMALSPCLEDEAGHREIQVEGQRQLLSAAPPGTRLVYLSSMSVFAEPGDQSEDTPCDARDAYGRGKASGEEVCAAFYGIILRLFLPLSVLDWQRTFYLGHFQRQTAAPDVARAISLALDAPGPDVFHITGVRAACGRARERLGWEPLARPWRCVRLARLFRRVLWRARKLLGLG